MVTRLDVRRQKVEEAVRVLSDDERKRADKFAFGRDRGRFILARAELRRLLAARLNISPESIEFRYGLYGKPLLAQTRSTGSLHFNTSHCDDIAAFAFSDSREIGIDIEAIRDLPDCDDIAESCFSLHEKQTYGRLNANEKSEGFFNCWTRKEAFVKALGDGLTHPLDSFDVSLAPGDPERILRIGSISGGQCGWQLHSFVPVSGYVGAVAIENQIQQDDCSDHLQESDFSAAG